MTDFIVDWNIHYTLNYYSYFKIIKIRFRSGKISRAYRED